MKQTIGLACVLGGLLSLVLLGQAPPVDTGVDDAALRHAARRDDWLTYGMNAAETRFSPLDEIHTGNVDRLARVWSADMQSGGGGQEATPLVWNGTLYVITNWSVVIAIDARTGAERWRQDPYVDQAAVRPAICCFVVNRGVALYRDLVIAPVIDGRLRALDALTGALVWESRVAHPEDHYTITMAPRIAAGKVIIGVSGADRPSRGFFDAYDAMTGQRAWRFYTVPGDPALGFENAAMARAASTWDGDWWTRGGGGAVWDGAAYDPDLGLVYVGTANAEPWAQTLRTSRGNDNLYVASILAVDVETGELRWHYQVVPGDSWDFDSVQHLILAEIAVRGRTRRVIMQANKNGFFYVIDRVTGQFLSAEPFAQVSWARGVDQRTGRPIVHDEAIYDTRGIRLSPGPAGAHNWSPMAFNPRTGLVYIPATTFSAFTYAAEQIFNPVPGRMTGIVLPAPAPQLPSPPAIGPPPVDTPNRGALIAWDPSRGRMRWRRAGGGALGGGALTTAGNLVFQVLGDGRLRAYSADRGTLLLDLDTGVRSGMGPPITYRLDGRQYVALMGGTGGSGPAAQSPRLMTFAVEPPPRVPTRRAQPR